MNTEKINGYVVITVDETFAVAHYGSQVVQTGTPDEVRAYCASEGKDTAALPAVTAAPESIRGTIWVCTCCVLTHANGECCANDEHGGDGCEPLSAIEAPFTVAMGMAYEEHSEDCALRTMGDAAPDAYQCDCERNTFSTSQCEGCGSWLHGERDAMTLFKA